MEGALDGLLDGRGERAVQAFYAALPGLPAAGRPALLAGMGYNFECYDALFALMAANVQLSMDGGDYTPRHRAMQNLLLPFASEFGVEPGRPLARAHRELYADFYRRVAGAPLPERYGGDENPWLAVSRRWARRMSAALACPGMAPLDRAKFNLGYHWAVERLSIDEFAAMRAGWAACGVSAPYLDAHCAVEEEHGAAARAAVLAMAPADDPLVARAAAAHEDHLAGYYAELLALLPRPAAARP